MPKFLKFCVFIILCSSLYAKPIKNIILLIPDGCSTDLLAISRWYQKGDNLYIDAHLRGLVKTYCSDSPIGDSAPTGSTYACGHRSQKGYIATYPKTLMNKSGKRIASDSNSAFSPMFTIMEAAKLDGKSTGLVATCYFPHATPASFLAHSPQRNDYESISKQMVYNACDVLFAGGSRYIDPSKRKDSLDLSLVLNQQGISYTNSLEIFRQDTNTKLWALFAEEDLPYTMDEKKPNKITLAEMTQEAISRLSKNKKGFFLMVEGSKIDWAAHDHDATAAVHEFLAFDQAVGVALDFAKKDEQTLVVICPDHATGGLSLGNSNSDKGASTISVSEILSFLQKSKKSVAALAMEILENPKPEFIKQSFASNYQITNLSSQNIEVLLKCKNGDELRPLLGDILSKHSYIGWTTYSHTGGDVFLAMYHPNQKELSGLIDNEALNTYMCQEANIPNLDSLSNRYYTAASIVFDDCSYKIIPATEKEDAILEVRKGKQFLRVFGNTSIVELNKKRINYGALMVSHEKGFYIPQSLRSLLGK